MTIKKLSTDQRRLLHRIRQAITTNPFSASRARVDAEIEQLAGYEPSATPLLSAIEAAEQVGRELAGADGAQISLFSGPDRELIHSLFQFIVFHRFMDRFDDHIREQIRAGDEPITLEFSQEISRDLKNFGYSGPETERAIAIFFQMRRAWFFIGTTLAGSSPCMEELRVRLWNNIFTHDLGLYIQTLWNRMEDFSTLLLGETGTGKGVAAAAMGRSGYIPFLGRENRFRESFTRAFLAINLSQIPEGLMESELFGHARGAFTGAVSDHKGVFARSSRHGAVFLDEIGELSTQTQVKLLRILQERSFTAVGSSKTRYFSGRVMAATNRNLKQLRREKKFRDDFYYRLCSDTITIPSLARRLAEDPAELELLADHLLQRITGSRDPELLDRVVQTLRRSMPEDYPWQGNVRELEQAIRRILLCGTCTPAPLPDRPADHQALFDLLDREKWTLARLSSWYCRELYARCGNFQQVARHTGLDRRTVKKYLDL